jgi:hypothetical protein
MWEKLKEISPEDLAKLKEAGVDIDQGKIYTQPIYTQAPIEKPSSCDVYRNNKIFLNNMLYMAEYSIINIEWLFEKFWVKSWEEADKSFEESNATLPYWWYNKLKKIYTKIQDIYK